MIKRKGQYSDEEKIWFLTKILGIIPPDVENYAQVRQMLLEIIDDITLNGRLVRGIESMTVNSNSYSYDSQMLTMSIQARSEDILKFFNFL